MTHKDSKILKFKPNSVHNHCWNNFITQQYPKVFLPSISSHFNHCARLYLIQIFTKPHKLIQLTPSVAVNHVICHRFLFIGTHWVTIASTLDLWIVNCPLQSSSEGTLSFYSIFSAFWLVQDSNSVFSALCSCSKSSKWFWLNSTIREIRRQLGYMYYFGGQTRRFWLAKNFCCIHIVRLQARIPSVLWHRKCALCVNINLQTIFMTRNHFGTCKACNFSFEQSKLLVLPKFCCSAGPIW